MKELLLGIDIGTSACKVALFSKDGSVKATEAEGYPLYYPHPGWAEQNPDDWWEAVCKATSRLITKSKTNPEEIAGIGIDGQSWSAVAIDHVGRVLGNTPLWMDTRAEKICEEVTEQIGEDKIFQVCGNLLRPSYTTGKILWYERERKDLYKKIYKVLQSNSFIGYRLTGVIRQDLSQSYAYHCFDMKNGTWDEDLCRELGIPRQFLPDLVPCHQVIGTVTMAAAKQMGLVSGIPVVAGGLDAACGALGAGVLHPGETQEQGGQAGGMSICLDQYAARKELILSNHVVPGEWLLQGGTTGGGGVMRWLEREFAQYEREKEKTSGKSSLVQLNDLAQEVKAGSDGVIFLPYMAGERSPIWDPKAKGVFYGLDFGKTKGHLVRAAMEGVAYSLKHNLDVAEQGGVMVKELKAVGGSANSPLWTQMKADITGKRVVVPASDTATTLGAALLAGVGVGLYQDFEEAVNKTVTITKRYEPDMQLHKSYKEYYERYLRLYQQLKGIMNQDGGCES